MTKTLQHKDFPAYYLAADRSSLKAQNRYKRIITWNLVLLIATSLISCIDKDVLQCIPFVNYFNVLAITACLILSSILFYFKFEQGWYEGRALAESIKTMTWKLMIAANPYGYKIDNKQVILNFITDLRNIVEETPNSDEIIDTEVASNDQVTQKMIQVRDLTYLEKKDFYLEHRINDQLNWYNQKAKYNRNKSRLISILIIVFQALALITAILSTQIHDIKFDFLPLFVALTTASIAWVELKRYRELSQSYSITAHDLALIRSKGAYIDNEDELGEFVEEAERAISREHTLWLARRGNSDYLKKTK